MTRIGILGINDLTEIFLSTLFHLAPDAHVFLSAGEAERANLLARKFPCWIQDNNQAVVDETDTVLTTQQITRSGNVEERIEYRQTQLVLLLDSRPLFNDRRISSLAAQHVNIINRQVTLQNLSPCFPLSNAQLDNYLFVLRTLVLSLQSVHALEITIQSFSESARAGD